MSEKRFDPMTGQPINQTTPDANQTTANVNQTMGNVNQTAANANQAMGNVNQPVNQQGQPVNQAPNQFQERFGNIGQQAGNFQQPNNIPQSNNFQQPNNIPQNQYGYGAPSFGGNNIPPQGNDKKKLFIIGGIVAAFLIIITVVNVAVFMGRNKNDNSNVAVAEASEEASVAPTKAEPEEDTDSSVEATTAATEVPEEKEEKEQKESSSKEVDPNGMSSFSIYGKNYSLPMKIQDLIDDGWQYNKDSDAKILLGSGNYEMVMLLTPGEDTAKIDVNVTNFSIDAKELGECYITEITFMDITTNKEGMNLSFHDGAIKIKESTKEDVVAAYGEPARETDTSSSVIITFEEANDTDLMTRVETRFSFDKEDNKLSYVVIENEEKPSDMGEETVSGDEPEYLSKYKAPSSLGDDLLSGNISINGKVYNVPVPLKVLLEDGWSLGGDDTHTVGANSGYSITLAKGDDRIYVNAYNLTTSACYIKYTIVTEITYYTSSYSKVEIELPGGVNGSTTQKDLEALLSSKGISNYEYDKSYGHYKIPIDQNRRNKIDIHVDDDGSMESISLQNYGWLLE